MLEVLSEAVERGMVLKQWFQLFKREEFGSVADGGMRVDVDELS